MRVWSRRDMGSLVFFWLTIKNICPRNMRLVRHLIIPDWFIFQLLYRFLVLNGFVNYFSTSKSCDSLAMFEGAITLTCYSNTILTLGVLDGLRREFPFFLLKISHIRG